MDFLLFQVYGPMAAWGDIAVGEYRPSSPQPSKSAVIGLLAAALGILRNEEDRLGQLSDGYGFATCVVTQGELIRDYHTAQVPPARKGALYYTRQDELAADSLNTILSQRDYRVDAAYTVALWKKQDAPWDLQELAEALRKPKLALYLGRKACPLALPLNPQIVNTDTLRTALDQVNLGEEFLQTLPLSDTVSWYWESLDGKASGMEPDMHYPRHDRLLSRNRWQYTNREEYSRLEKREQR